MTNLINEQANQEIDNFLAQWKEKQKDHAVRIFNYVSNYKHELCKWSKSDSEVRKMRNSLSYSLGFAIKQNCRSDVVYVESTLNKEVAKRKQNLINSIINKGGNIISVLHMRFDIDLDGAFECEKGTVTLNTIGAGGYNIQCYHYRTLIKLKK
tara:strand:- start:2300 stop:2758 length:459 start_codon:yes stop_codon:yes gene_type:complete